uniref:Uncharacterized protein n=1 Tax=Anguilla anguilla TaxID=7936 RepID=A0A0E9WLA3_ANGAN
MAVHLNRMETDPCKCFQKPSVATPGCSISSRTQTHARTHMYRSSTIVLPLCVK